MPRSRTLAFILTALLVPFCFGFGHAPGEDGSRSPLLVIAHRGASGYLPEHTLAAYAMAYAQGADMIEPDLVASRDGVLVCLHDLTLEDTTDVRSVFPGRARPDGKWYAIDFDLAELKRLEKHGRGTKDNGYRIATLDEMITLVHRLNERTGRTVGIVPEMKHPAFHQEHGVDLAALTIESLAAHGYDDAADRIYLQCFDADTLQRVRHEFGSELPLMYLSSDPLDAESLERLGAWCNAFGTNRKHLDPAMGGDSSIIRIAQRHGLIVVPYTLGDDPADTERLLSLGVDGVFTDFPDIAICVRNGTL